MDGRGAFRMVFVGQGLGEGGFYIMGVDPFPFLDIPGCITDRITVLMDYVVLFDFPQGHFVGNRNVLPHHDAFPFDVDDLPLRKRPGRHGDRVLCMNEDQIVDELHDMFLLFQ